MTSEYDYRQIVQDDSMDESRMMTSHAPGIVVYKSVRIVDSTSWRSYLRCNTSRICAAWTIPLLMLSIGMWIATGYLVVHVECWGVSLIPMFMGSVVVTGIAGLPWFELVRYNKMSVAEAQEASEP